MEVMGISSLARRVPHPQVARARSRSLWGVVVHTTGRGLVQRAMDRRRLPLDLAIDLYCAAGANGPHYVIGSAGETVAVCDELLCARHAGIDDDERQAYATGLWSAHLSSEGLELWAKRWPGATSPLDLFPAGPVNDQYIGIELIPCARREIHNSTLFTDAQYEALNALLSDIEKRHDLILDGSRLVGHEDINPLRRWDDHGGWDPGAVRAQPYFRWELLRRPRVPSRGRPPVT